MTAGLVAAADKNEKTDRVWFLDAVAEGLKQINLVPIERLFQVEGKGFKFEALPTLRYNSAAAFAYAATYCGRNSNSCGKFYDSDCAHFMSHCLAAGGVGVTGGDSAARCPAGLCIRAEELAAAFYNSTKKFSNVTQLNSYDQGRRGDYGFLKNFHPYKSHAFLLAGTPSATSGPVYAHTTNHCGDAMDTIRIYFGAYYRIS
jgi:hypothetical protein